MAETKTGSKKKRHTTPVIPRKKQLKPGKLRKGQKAAGSAPYVPPPPED